MSFDALGDAADAIVGAPAGRYLLGFVIIFLVVVFISLVAQSGQASILMMGFGNIFVVLIGYWPPFSLIVAALFILIALFNPFEKGSAAGGGGV